MGNHTVSEFDMWCVGIPLLHITFSDILYRRTTMKNIFITLLFNDICNDWIQTKFDKFHILNILNLSNDIIYCVFLIFSIVNTVVLWPFNLGNSLSFNIWYKWIVGSNPTL